MNDNQADKIRAGLRKRMLNDYTDSSGLELTYMCFGYLSSLCAQLISDDEGERSRAKASVQKIIGGAL
jgi:hypothetical protein